MKPFRWNNGVWVLAMILGLMGASCATHVERKGAGVGSQGAVADIRLRTPDSGLRTTKEPDAATKATMQAAYGKLPLSFEANQGQSDSQVKFLSRGSGYSLTKTVSVARYLSSLPLPHSADQQHLRA